jgi:hypothetical protein
MNDSIWRTGRPATTGGSVFNDVAIGRELR